MCEDEIWTGIHSLKGYQKLEDSTTIWGKYGVPTICPSGFYTGKVNKNDSSKLAESCRVRSTRYCTRNVHIPTLNGWQRFFYWSPLQHQCLIERHEEAVFLIQFHSQSEHGLKVCSDTNPKLCVIHAIWSLNCLCSLFICMFFVHTEKCCEVFDSDCATAGKVVSICVHVCLLHGLCVQSMSRICFAVCLNIPLLSR